MRTKTTLLAIVAFLLPACWLFGLATANDHVLTRFSSKSEQGKSLPAPVNISFKFSETTALPDTTNGKLPEGRSIEYAESSITVDTDGLNLLELKLKDGRKVTFEFRVNQ
ncbi:hypothetical protein [Crateriforma spongiae]|uniref:hypothetical protein n=1 Tax=Crateriforma spongiae TaxID=2724528 RepID=UPI0039B048FB